MRLFLTHSGSQAITAGVLINTIPTSVGWFSWMHWMIIKGHTN